MGLNTHAMLREETDLTPSDRRCWESFNSFAFSGIIGKTERKKDCSEPPWGEKLGMPLHSGNTRHRVSVPDVFRDPAEDINE